uniref:Odorant Binding Protein 12 n=1 Tax=Dendrolimus punctatus TaxID=238572 RepID=A0A2K8GKL7_9NEOP|nr:Odorant Binding Protein 12 [Dendrolimus punctatus]
MNRAFAIIFSSLYFIGFFCFNNAAVTQEQLTKLIELVETFGQPCLKDNPVAEDDIAAMKAHKIPTGPNAPCFIACMMRKATLLGDDGKLQKEPALEIAKTILDETQLKNIDKLFNSCAEVNTAEVSDGTKGCQRAMLALKCLKENAPKYGFGDI